MEQVAKHPIIIELNGLPGTGKTTIAKQLAEQMSQLQYDCHFSYYAYPWQRNFRDVSILLNSKNLRLFSALRKYAKTFPSAAGRLSSVIATLRYFRMYRDFLNREKGKLVLIVDQGIVQGMLSIAHQNAITSGEPLLDVVRMMVNSCSFIRIDCLCDVELSQQRIKQRHSQSGRLDVMEISEQLETLQTQKSNLDCLRSVFSTCASASILIDTSFPPAESAKIVLNKINSYEIERI